MIGWRAGTVAEGDGVGAATDVAGASVAGGGSVDDGTVVGGTVVVGVSEGTTVGLDGLVGGGIVAVGVSARVAVTMWVRVTDGDIESPTVSVAVCAVGGVSVGADPG